MRIILVSLAMLLSCQQVLAKPFLSDFRRQIVQPMILASDAAKASERNPFAAKQSQVFGAKKSARAENANSHNDSRYSNRHNDSGDYRRDRRQDKQHGTSKRHHYHGHRYCELDHSNDHRENRHHNQHQNQYYNQYRNGHYKDQGRSHYSRNVKWHKAGDFRTRRRNTADRDITIRHKVAALELVATKRTTHIDRAYVEFRNGNIRRIPSLEGHLSWGEPLIHHFRDQRYVVALHLEVSSEGRKRSYARVNYKEYH